MLAKIENRIDKLSLRLKIDLKYILHGGGWLFGAQAFSTLCSFGLVWFLTNYLSKETYGEYKYIISLFGIVSVLSLSGYGPAIASSIARGKDLIYKKAFTKIFLSSFPASIVSIIIAFYYLYQNNITLFIGLLLIGLTNPLTNAYQIYSSFLSGKKDFRSITLFGAIPDILTFFFTTLAILFTQNAGVLAGVFLAVNLLATFIAFYLTNKKYKQNNELDEASLKHAVHNSAINIFSNVVQNMDKVLVFHYLGAVELAIYSIVTQIPDQMKGIFKTVPDLVMAKYSERMHLKQNNIWLKIFYLGIIVAAMIAVYIALSPIFFKIFFPTYANYVYLSNIYALSLVAVILFLPLTIIQAHQKTKELYWVTTSTSVVQLLSAFVGVFYFGLIGIVIARIVTRIFSLVVYLLVLRQITK